MSTSNTTQFGTDCYLMEHMDGTGSTQAFTDSSVSNHSLTVFGSGFLNTVTSKFGGAAAAFDGGSSGVYAPNDSNFNIATGSDFTVDFWFNTRDGATANIIGNGWNEGFELFYSAAVQQLQFINSGANILLGSQSSVLNTWYHIAIVRSSNRIDLYKNGVSLVNTSNYSKPITSTQRFCVGNDILTSASLNGFIDEFRFVNGTSVWNSNFTSPVAAYTAVPGGTVSKSNTFFGFFDQ